MRPLKSHFPENALPTLETILKQTQEARVFRRAQAVREVVAGHHINAVSATFHLANSALRKWVQRFAHEGPQGLLDRPRSGRPARISSDVLRHISMVVSARPRDLGIPGTRWSLARLRQYLVHAGVVPTLSLESLRVAMKRAGLAFTSARAGQIQKGVTTMIPGAFEYHAPSSIAEATALLAKLGDDAKILSGGQSLIPLMKLRLASPRHLIDINGLPGLSYVREEDGTLRFLNGRSDRRCLHDHRSTTAV